MTWQCFIKAPSKWTHIFVPGIPPSEQYLYTPGSPLLALSSTPRLGWSQGEGDGRWC